VILSQVPAGIVISREDASTELGSGAGGASARPTVATGVFFASGAPLTGAANALPAAAASVLVHPVKMTLATSALNNVTRMPTSTALLSKVAASS
jgi:hypothetical protein